MTIPSTPRSRKPDFERLLAELRERVAASPDGPSPATDAGALAQALHEIDVCYAELDMQNHELRTVQLELQGARDRYRALFDNAPVAVVGLTVTGLIRDVNRRASVLLGKTNDRLAGKPFAAFLAEGESSTFFRILAEAASQPAAGEIKLRSSNGMRLLQVQVERLSATGEPIWLCHLTDITAVRDAERVRDELQNRLRESEMLEAVGRVAANIAHDVNNTLVTVISLAEFMKSQTASDEALQRDCGELLEAAWRSARLMRGLLGLARLPRGTRAPLDIARLIQRFAGTQQHVKPTVVVTVSVPDHPVWVLADEDELFHLLANLATNALEAMDSGTLRLGCEVRRTEGLPVRVEVADTGNGMSEATLSRAFEPLFTTKSATGGSGLGLTIVHQTVTALGGTIAIASVPSQGTRVIIDLPAHTNASLMPLAPAQSQPRSLWRVLVVDDDEAVLRSTRRLLESAGLKVTGFADGIVALASLGATWEFDAAVVDVNMPSISGPDFVNALFTKYGPVSVVFVTGASGELVPPALLLKPGVRLLRKPWSRAGLIEAIEATVGHLGTPS